MPQARLRTLDHYAMSQFSEVSPLRQRRIFVFWLPLAATWMMMAVEGPFLAAIIARLAEPKFNLAAYGVAFAFAIIIESPVIMIMSATTALAEDGPSFRRLRRFTYSINAIITGFQVVFLVTPLFGWVTGSLMNLPPQVVNLTRTALWILLPWPGAIGYRRLYQGLLIRSGLTRRVAYGTIFRLSAMGATALLLYFHTNLPGAIVGATALAAGVCSEAVVIRLMTRVSLRDLSEPKVPHTSISYSAIVRFYVPLAMTSTISLAAAPMVTFFMGHAVESLASLAVLPVVNSLSFIFRSPALAFHDVVIALMGEGWRQMKPLRTFASLLALAVTLGMALIAWTPMAKFWFGTLGGLTPDLIAFALPPARILILFPMLSVLLAVQRAILVCGRRTDPITWATAAELAGIAGFLWLTIDGFGLVGATCAAIAYTGGRCVSTLLLVRPVTRLLRES
jgi:hypothetical protein